MSPVRAAACVCRTSAGLWARAYARNLGLVHRTIPKGAMEEAEGAEFVLDDDCLENIVACTSSGSTLFALARVSPTLKRLVLARLEAMNVFVPHLYLYSHRALLTDSLRYVGATVWNQYVTYDYNVFRFFAHDTNEQSWKHFLSHLPVLKRIFILCCCQCPKLRESTNWPPIRDA